MPVPGPDEQIMGGHEILAVGYLKSEPDYVLCRNSLVSVMGRRRLRVVSVVGVPRPEPGVRSADDREARMRCDGKPQGLPLEFKDGAAARRYLAHGTGARKSRRARKHGRQRGR